MTPFMSKQLSISSALSVLMMAAYALFGPHTITAPDHFTSPIGQAQAAPVAKSDAG